MKKLILGSMLLTIVALVACEKAEIQPANSNGNATPGKSSDSLAAKKGGGGAPTATVGYGGQATGLNATIWNFGATVTSRQIILAQTKLLPGTGGAESATLSDAAIAGTLTAEFLQSSTTGQDNYTLSQSSATNLNITVGGNVITASSMQSTATAGCGSVFSGSSVLNDLVINGVPVVVSRAANQTIYLKNRGMIIINEQSTSKKGGLGSIQVTALHIIIPNVADIRIATSRAEIKC
jgi:hypothetical protein